MGSVISIGSAKSLRTLDEVVGKTGTTNQARDAWFAGSLSDAPFAAWVGLDVKALGGRNPWKNGCPHRRAYVAAAEMDGPAWPPPPEGVVNGLSLNRIGLHKKEVEELGRDLSLRN